MTGIVYIATSLDGFIARTDGSVDWLPEPADDAGTDFADLMDSVDALVMGRKTYDTVLGFGVWPYGTKPVFVLTHRDLTPPDDPAAYVESIAGSPAEITAQLRERGYNNLYIDGGSTIQAFLRAGEIHRLIITRIPVLLGQGVSLFGELEGDIQLTCLRSEKIAGGLEQAEYEVTG